VSAAEAGGREGMIRELLREVPVDRLRKELENYLEAAGKRLVNAAADQAGSAVERLTDYTERGGGPAAEIVSGAARAITPPGGGAPKLRGLVAGGLSAVPGALMKSLGKGGGGGAGGQGQKQKVTNIVEQIDVGVPRPVAYGLWTRFEDFPSFMKKVESVQQEEDQQLTWKAQVLWSHRTWRSTITEQVPDERVVWRSEADKGYVDGAVTFHSLTPDLTRILLVLEYHPKGFFEGTGNLWRAPGRRARLELKHFRRHAMTETILHQDEVDGWPGEIRDGEVVQDGDNRDRAEDSEDDRDADESVSEDDDRDEDDRDDEEEDRDADDEEYDRDMDDEYDDRDEDDEEYDDREDGDRDEYEDEDSGSGADQPADEREERAGPRSRRDRGRRDSDRNGGRRAPARRRAAAMGG
jgi:uncharacterized membrane protein